MHKPRIQILWNTSKHDAHHLGTAETSSSCNKTSNPRVQRFEELPAEHQDHKTLLLGMPLQLKAAASAAAAPTAANQTTAALASSSTAPQLYTTSCYPTHNLRHDWKGPPATTGFDNIGLLRTPAILSAYMTWSNIKFGHSHTAVGVAQ
jgi:hypothetical protein